MAEGPPPLPLRMKPLICSIEHLLLQYRVPWERIPHCIIKLDSNAFQTADDVRAVLQCVPTQDEANMLHSYVRAGGSLQGLSPAELFCLALMKVCFLHRLNILAFLDHPLLAVCPKSLPASVLPPQFVLFCKVGSRSYRNAWDNSLRSDKKNNHNYRCIE